MHWKIKASLQKILSFTRQGDAINHIPATLKSNYHQNVFTYQFLECVRKFDLTKLDLKVKPRVALEIGTGYSIIAPIVLYLLGFDKILTIDISNDISFNSFQKQFKEIRKKDFRNILSDKGIHDLKVLNGKINDIEQCNSLQEVLNYCHIEYLPNHTIEKLSKEKLTLDYIYSQVVFEHIRPKQLELLFAKTKEWLSSDGYSVHTINFIDHYANPGLFGDKNISEFNFLKFSNDEWEFWSGNDIAYTNRLSYIFYTDLCKKYNLRFEFKGQIYREQKPIDSNLIHEDVLSFYDSKPNLEELQKYQRGTIVIQKSE